MAVSVARSRRAGNRQNRAARTQAGQVIDWVRETWGAEPDKDITLNESPISLVRQWARHRGVQVNETSLVQSLRRHPRYETLEGGSRARRPTYILKARSANEPEPETTETTEATAEPKEEQTGTLHHLPSQLDKEVPAEAGDLLGQAIEAVRRAAHAEAEARFEGELLAHQTLIREELERVQELHAQLGRSLVDLRGLMNQWKVSE